MILYFSGTGNSEYVAKRIAKKLNQTTVNVGLKIKNHDFEALTSNQAWVIVAPTYAWRMPRIVEQWLKKVELNGSKDVYFVLTCGGDIGNGAAYVKRLCRFKQLQFKGCFEVVMPENYIAMFKTPSLSESIAQIEASESRIDSIIEHIEQQADIEASTSNVINKIKSGIVNDAFYLMFVHDKKFTVNSDCIGCNLCAKLCPMNSIKMVNQQPVWLHNCTHCMACISHCPKEAIEYGQKSVGQPRYICPKKS